MTVGAVFHDRRMLPEKWPATFGVAAVAVFINRALNQLNRVRAAMRIVTTGACNFAFAVGHVRGALELRAPHLVALETKLGLRLFRAHVFGERRAVAYFATQRRITLRLRAVVNLMAIHASHGSRFVGAAAPEHLIA